MKNKFSHLILTALMTTAAFFACTVSGTLDGTPEVKPTVGEKQMILYFSSEGKKTFSLAGTGTVSIDWGDGSKKETHSISSALSTFAHNYTGRSDYQIIITGANITRLHCINNNLIRLDVSDNTVLAELNCSDNRLPNDVLDVSKNTALTELNCSNNRLSSLEISKNTKLTTLILNTQKNGAGVLTLGSLKVSNTALTELNCSIQALKTLEVKNNTKLVKLNCRDNQLTSLDVSTNPALIEVDCSNNNLNNSALSTLFKSLPVNDVMGKTIKITGNSNSYNAKDLPKNWVIIDK